MQRQQLASSHWLSSDADEGDCWQSGGSKHAWGHTLPRSREGEREDESKKIYPQVGLNKRQAESEKMMKTYGDRPGPPAHSNVSPLAREHSHACCF